MTDDEKRQAWLKGLKAGDIVVRVFGRSGRELLAVEKVTPTQVVLHRDMRYRKADGRSTKPGYGYTPRSHIEEPTPDKTADIRREMLVRRLEGVRWAEFGLEVLEAVAAALPKAPSQTAPATADE